MAAVRAPCDGVKAIRCREPVPNCYKPLEQIEPQRAWNHTAAKSAPWALTGGALTQLGWSQINKELPLPLCSGGVGQSHRVALGQGIKMQCELQQKRKNAEEVLSVPESCLGGMIKALKQFVHRACGCTGRKKDQRHRPSCY